MTKKILFKKEYLIVLVASLGYFVDAYDLILFIVIRKSSLLGIGIPPNEITSIGLSLFNVQMIGTFLGGILFGVLGDKKGRLSVLFASIIVYSVANLLNAGVTELWQYYVLRFIAGVGLAGELGAGITIVAEVMPQKYRGYGTAIVAASGAAGAFTAGLVSDLTDWRLAYVIGGCMGLCLLLLRINTFESEVFLKTKSLDISRGNFLSLFSKKTYFKKYFAVMLMSLPIFFTISILMQLAPEVAKQLGVAKEVKSGTAVMFVYLGLTIGDLASGLIAQFLKNRKLTIQIFLIISIIMTVIHLFSEGISYTNLCIIYVFLGFAAGFWVSLITLSAEQFGTHIRATVATTIPNFARGAAVPILFLYQYLIDSWGFQILQGALITGVFCFCLAFVASFTLKDSFANNLDFIE